jgi:streptomycin 6-kinase
VTFPIPRHLAEAVDEFVGVDRRPWLDRLPALVAGLVEHWSLDLDDPYEPGGTASWVAPARTAAGHEVVLKVEWRHYEADHEAAGLELWDGDGAVRLLAVHGTDDTYAYLLERCVPGTSLRDALPEPEQDVVLAGLLRRLWVEPPPGHPFRPLQSMCDAWADEFEARAAEGAHRLDPGLERAGVQLWRALPGEVDDTVLLPTDLHPMNVLAAEREPWLVIDPKPYVGDRHYDPLQHMFNCEARLVADPVGLARRMSNLLDLDAERLLRWLFARSVVEHEWWPSARDLAPRIAP